jgi:hypothetical protein
VILYSSDADADRRFLVDLLDRPTVDAGGGWLIAQLPPSEVAVHPAETSGAIELYLVCDDVDATVAEWTGRGVAFEAPVSDQGWAGSRRSGCPAGDGWASTRPAIRWPSSSEPGSAQLLEHPQVVRGHPHAVDDDVLGDEPAQLARGQAVVTWAVTSSAARSAASSGIQCGTSSSTSSR